MMASWERGRLARTRPGTASAISSTWNDPTAPRLSFDLAVAVTADEVAACKVALMLSDPHMDQDAGGTPALPGDAKSLPPGGKVAEAEPARPMIPCGFADAQDYRTPDSQNQILCILCIDVN